MKLSITRSGQFHAKFTGNLNSKCDLERVNYYNYEVRIDATSEHLSPEGFIIENSRVQSWFETTFANPRSALSCERIAIEAAQGLADLCLRDSISILAVCCSVTGSNGALLSATWERATWPGW